MIISFIGLGEVGSAYSSGLAKNGAKVRGYDLKFQLPQGKAAFSKCSEAGVELVDGPAQLIEGADIILAVTSCHEAIDTARMYEPYLTAGQRYIELNSAVPGVKAEVWKMLSGKCDCIDGATLCSPTQYGVATPVVMAGERAVETLEYLNAHGMNISCLGSRVGQAAAFKVLRSIYTKGLLALMYESLMAARKWEVNEQAIEHIVKHLTQPSVDQAFTGGIVNFLNNTDGREQELGVIYDWLGQEGLDRRMTKAALEKFSLFARLCNDTQLNDEAPEELYGFIACLHRAQDQAAQA